MARYNAMEETFTEVRVLGKPVLFHDLRIDRSTVPKGLYLYEVRYDDEGLGDPVQIAKGSWSIILVLLLPVNRSDCHRTGI